MEQIILNAIHGYAANSVVRSFNSSGGWIIEAIHPTFQNVGATEQALFAAISAAVPQAQQPLVIWKMFVYASEEESFSVAGTLHTRFPDHDDEGIQTTYLEANDSYVNLSEFDAEILQLGPYQGREVVSTEALNENGDPILPYQPEAHYRWLETLGGQYNLEPDNPTELQDGQIVVRLANVEDDA